MGKDLGQIPIDGHESGWATTKGNSEHDGERSAERQVYQIRIKGYLDSRWSSWLGNLTMIHKGDGTTVLTGPVADQPALHGLLIKVRDLGLMLLSVKVLEPDRWSSNGPQVSSGDESASGRREEPR